LIERGDIWLVSLDPSSGHEQQGRRPVLIVTSAKFNRTTGVPVVVPITSGGRFARSIGFAVPLAGGGTRTVGIVRCDHPRALDLRARKATKLESVPQAILDEVLARLRPIFD
jgi:mRNA interferase ChpB